MKKSKFPKQLYVVREEDTDGSYFFVAYDNADDVAARAENEVAGVYVLDHTVDVIRRCEVKRRK